MARPPHYALRQQVTQGSVDGGVRLAQDERQLRRLDERRPAEGVEQLSVAVQGEAVSSFLMDSGTSISTPRRPSVATSLYVRHEPECTSGFLCNSHV